MNFLLDVFCVNNGTQKIQPNTAKGKDEEDEFDDPDDRSSTGERVTPSNAGTNAFNELLHANTSFHEIVAGWLGDDETRKNFNEMESDEERRKREADEIEEETKRMEDRAKAKKRKEEYEKHAENMRKEETMKSESERINGKGSFSYINSTSSSPSSKNPYLAEEPIPYDPNEDEETRQLRLEQERKFAERRKLDEKERRQREEQIRLEKDKKRAEERAERLKREDMEAIQRHEREMHLREMEELERLRAEQDAIDREFMEAELKRQEIERFKQLKIEQEAEKKMREKETKKVSKLLQKQIDRQELARQSIGGSSKSQSISKELVQKITEVQVNEELENSYVKKKEEEYERIKAVKVKEAEDLEAQKNSVLNWMVGGLLAPQESVKEHKAFVYDPNDLSRSPFEKHLTDVGFRVNLYKYESTGYGEEGDEFKDDIDESSLTATGYNFHMRKAIVRYDPSFNSIYLDVKKEGTSIIFHFNVKRDIKEVVRGVRSSSTLYYEEEPPERTKYVSFFLKNSMKDVIMEFESVKAAQTVFGEMKNFVKFRTEHPTIEVTAEDLFPPPLKHIDSNVLQPSVLAPNQYPSIFTLERSIDPKKIVEAPKLPPKVSVGNTKEAVKGLGEALLSPTKLFGSDDPDYGSGEKKSEKKGLNLRDKLKTCLVWYQWVRMFRRDTTGLMGSPKYRLIVFGSNGSICYYSYRDDSRDDSILTGLEALRSGLWDEDLTLYELGFKKEGVISKSQVTQVKPNASKDEPYIVEVGYGDLGSSLTFACDSESKWQDAILSFKTFTSKDYK